MDAKYKSKKLSQDPHDYCVSPSVLALLDIIQFQLNFLLYHRSRKS